MIVNHVFTQQVLIRTKLWYIAHVTCVEDAILENVGTTTVGNVETAV